MKKDNIKYNAYTISDNPTDMMIDETDSHDVSNLVSMIANDHHDDEKKCSNDDEEYGIRISSSDLMIQSIIAGVFIMNLIIVFISMIIQ